MILHTIMQPETIFEEVKAKEALIIKEITFEGVILEVEKRGEQNYIVQRMISSNPSDYLRPDLQPGTVLTQQIYPKP